MITPIWMALPPEVHSALLSSGAGPGPLLSAAAAWTALSDEYVATAAELTSVLTITQSGQWEGRGAEQYLAAHTPYLAWLNQAGVNTAGAAAQLETAASSYTAALATMPTLAELAVNRTTLSVLVATNFFGLNTIPIAVTEADYARMWLQAATTMAVYQSISATTLAAIPQTAPAPSIVHSGAQADSAVWTDPIEQWLAWSEHFSSMYRMLKRVLTNPLGTLIQVIIDFASDPAAAAVTWLPLFYLFAYAATFALLGTPIYAAIMGPAAATAIPLALGFSGLATMAQVPTAQLPFPTSEPHNLPTTAAIPTTPTSTVSTPQPPAPASASPTPTAAPPVPNPPPAAGTPPLYYAVTGAGPNVGFGPPLHQHAPDAASRSRDIGETAAATAVTAAARKSRTNRRRSADVKERGYRYEFLASADTTTTPVANDDTRVTASVYGSPLGSTVPTIKSGLHAAKGMTTLTSDTFGATAKVPMVPQSWAAEESHQTSGTMTDETAAHVAQP